MEGQTAGDAAAESAPGLWARATRRTLLARGDPARPRLASGRRRLPAGPPPGPPPGPAPGRAGSTGSVASARPGNRKCGELGSGHRKCGSRASACARRLAGSGGLWMSLMPQREPIGCLSLCRRPFKSVHMKSKRGIRGWKDKVLSACGYLESLLS